MLNPYVFSLALKSLIALADLQNFYSQPRFCSTFHFRIKIRICIFYFIILHYELQ